MSKAKRSTQPEVVTRYRLYEPDFICKLYILLTLLSDISDVAGYTAMAILNFCLCYCYTTAITVATFIVGSCVGCYLKRRNDLETEALRTTYDTSAEVCHIRVTPSCCCPTLFCDEREAQGEEIVSQEYNTSKRSLRNERTASTSDGGPHVAMMTPPPSCPFLLCAVISSKNPFKHFVESGRPSRS